MFSSEFLSWNEYSVLEGRSNIFDFQAGGKVDDLSTIGSLKTRKGDWESSAKEATMASIEKKSIAEAEIASGKVKSNLERFVMGASNTENNEEDEDVVDGRDPDIVREDKKHRKKELKFDQVGDLKIMWNSGNVQGADISEISKDDLEELRKGPHLKERYQEKTEPDTTVVKQWDGSELQASGAADARRSFLEGSAYQTTPVEKISSELTEMEFKKLQEFKERFEKGEGEIQVEKTQIDIHAEVGDIKSAFEKGGEYLDMTPEERAELKKKQIEEEFLRYKLARRAAAQRQAAEKAAAGEEVAGGGVEPGTDVEVGSIKDRFETGEAFKSQHDEKQLDVEIKIAGKAREKFRQIDAEGAQAVAPNLQTKEKHTSKWDKKDGAAVPEPINRRVITDDDEELEDEDAYDVKNLMNKFKNIEKDETKAAKHERPSDLDTIKIEARNLKEQFEKAAIEDEYEAAEEKRKQLEEEFERLRREREQAAAERDESPEEPHLLEKEPINIAADHASKMTAKWEKIQKKEAKKAEKNRMVPKHNTQAVWKARLASSSPRCSCCGQVVYLAERLRCFSNMYHFKCFRCKHCGIHLRVENCQRSPDGALFCETHYRRLFVAQNSFIFRPNQQFVLTS